VVVLFEQGMFGLLIFVVSGDSRDGSPQAQLIAADPEVANALDSLSRLAEIERAKLPTGEISQSSDASEALTAAAARAWSVLPSEVRASVLRASTVFYMPTPVDP